MGLDPVNGELKFIETGTINQSNTEYKGEHIGVWIKRQRCARKGNSGRLKITHERIDMLNSIGMRWE